MPYGITVPGARFRSIPCETTTRDAQVGDGEGARFQTGFRIAASAFDRLRGLLFAPRSREALLLVRCNDIHTCGMKDPIDVAFIDKTGRVIAAQRGLAPMRRMRCRDAVATIERIAQAGPWLERGDRVGLEAMVRNRQIGCGKGGAL